MCKTHICRRLTQTLAFTVATIPLSLQPADARVFTGTFQGQGEACWGNLYIRTKTIEWDAQYSICRSPYTIIARRYTGDGPHENDDYIIYKLDHVGKKCSFPYIGLYFYHYFDAPGWHDDWTVAGFVHFRDYQTFDYRRYVRGDTSSSAPGEGNVLFCVLPQYFDPPPD